MARRFFVSPTRYLRAALVPGLVFAVLVATPRASVAQSAAAQAQALFDQGRDLLKAGRIDEACTAFASSHKLDPAITTLLNLADCRAKNGQLASAWGHFVEAQRLARAAGDDKFLRVAAKHADKLKPRLSKLTIAVSAQNQVSGLVVMRGEALVDPATWNHSLPIDGGTYLLTATAPGKRPWTTNLTIKAEGDTKVIDVPLLLGSSERPAVAEKTSAPAASAAGAPAVATPLRPSVPTTAPPVVAPATAAAKPAPITPSAAPVATKAAPSAASAPSAVATTPTPVTTRADPTAMTTAAPAPAAGKETSTSTPAAPTRSPSQPAPPATAISTSKPLPVDTLPAPSSLTSKPSPTSPPADAEAAPSSPTRRSYALPLTLGALAFTAAAVAFKLSGDSYYDDAKSATTQDARASAYDTANTRRHVAFGLGATAVACAGAATYFYLRHRRENRPPSTALVPTASPQQAGVAIVGSW